MNTYNNFNELASAQHATPLHSDMSVFNAASAEQMRALARALEDAMESVRNVYKETDFGEYEGVREEVVNALNTLHTASIKATGSGNALENPVLYPSRKPK